MKRKFTLLIAALALLTMIVQPGRAWGQSESTSSLIFTAKCNGSGTADDDAVWTVTSDAAESNFDNTKGIHYGTSSAAVSYLNLTTADIEGTISQIVVNASGASGTSAKLDVTVGGVAFDTQKSLTSTATNYTLTGSASGEIVVSIHQNSAKKAIYCKSIIVTYTTGGGDLADSDLAITNASTDLTFDLYPSATPQVITYTTSSTGAITITPTSPTTYFSYEHDADNGTITVTPLAVTPSAQTVTISQAADNNYKAGSDTFTVSVANSTPTVTVTYHANGGTGDDIEATPYQGTDYTIANNTFLYANHTFTKWNTEANGSGQDKNPGDVIENISENIDLYAQWEESSEATATLNIASYATDHSWANDTQYSTATVSPVTFTANGGTSTGKYYTSGNEWRFYQTENASLTVSVADGYTLVSVTPTYSVKNNGALFYGETQLTSGSAVSVSGTSVNFTVGNSGTATNGQVKFTNIDVTYTTTGGSQTASDLAITNASTELVFDLYSSATPQDITYTTSSTGAITITPETSTYFSYVHNPQTKTITVTPLAVTPSAQTVTISQEADDNYYAGSTSFTVTIADSTPFVGGDVTFDATEDTGTSPLVKSGVTFTCTNGVLNNGSEYRLYKNSVTTFSVPDGYSITQIAFTGVSGNPASGFETQDGWTTDGDNGTWTGEAQAVSFTASGAQVRATVIVVTVTAPTTDPYITANNVNILYDATAGAIEYEIHNPASGTLTAATESDWITVGTVGETVPFTCTVNPTAGSRTATVTLTYTYNTSETATKDVTVTQAGNPTVINNISTIDLTTPGKYYRVKGTILAKSSSAFVIGDNTGYVYTYKTTESSVNDKVVIEGTTGQYGHIIQFTNSATITASETSNYNGEPAVEVITTIPNYSTGLHLSTYLQFEGSLSKDTDAKKTLYLIEVGGSSICISYPTTEQTSTMDDLDGKTVRVKGYFAGYNSSSYFTVIMQSIEEVIPSSIAISPATINEVPCYGGGGVLTVTYTNMGDNPNPSVIECDSEGNATDYDWLTAVFENENANIRGTIAANESTTDRTAYLKVCGTDANSETVCSNIVSITQLGYPTITTAELPFTFDGNNEAIEATDGIVQAGLGSSYGDSPKLKFKETGSFVILHFNETPGILTYDIQGDEFNGTFKVQASADNVTYTDLKVYTSSNLTSTKLNESFDDLASTVRYIKWVYTEADGKVRLGNIGLTDHNPAIIPATYAINVDAGEHTDELAVTYQWVEEDMAEVVICDAEGNETTYDWFTAEVDDTDYNVTYMIGANETPDERKAYFMVYSIDENADDVYSEIVTVTQEGSVALYTITFNTNGGTFDGNADFGGEIVQKQAGTYELPSAYKDNVTFAGWLLNGTETIYEAGAQYEVTGNASFTAQWNSAMTGLIEFGIADGHFNFNANNTTGLDNLENTWTVTVVGTTSYTTNAEYIQVGSKNNPATSITFTTTLPSEANITAFSAKFGGNTDTAGHIDLIVGETTVGEGTLNATEDVTVTNTSTASGTILTVTVTNIARGVKCYYISYTYVVNTDPYITIANDEIEVPAAGDDDYIAIAYGNLEIEQASDFAIQFYDNEDNEINCPSWITTAEVTTQSGQDGYFVHYVIGENSGTDDRSAYFKVWTLDDDIVYSNLVTITQAAPAPTYMVMFELDGGDFVQNSDFDDVIVEKEAGTYNLPSATKDGFNFAGWNDGENTYETNASYDVSGDVTFTAQWTAIPVGVTYTLVETANDLVPGLHYIIAGNNKGEWFAMGVQNSNNRAAVSITVNDNVATVTSDDVYDFVISGDSNENGWTIYDESTESPGYLYAASSGSNHLKTRANNNDGNSQWDITFDNSVASIVAQGSYTRNVMQFNTSNTLFACYGSASQSAVYLYKKNGDTDPVYYSPTIVEVENPNADAESIVILNNEIFTYTGTLKCSSPDHLVIHDGGQLIHGQDVPATLLKDYEAAPWPSSKSVSGWYTIASPVDGGDLSAVVSNVTNYDFFAYDEAAYTWRNQKVPANNINAFEQGIGYLYATAAAKQGSFAGTMKATNATIEKDLSYACTLESLKGFNLMGNPFTRNLTSADVEIDGTALTNYYVVEGGSELEVRNIADNPIKPGQGFMVQATAENQTLVFNPGTGKGRSANNGYISLAVSNESFNDMAYINIANGNTLRKMTLNADSPKVYVMNDNKDYAAARVESLSGSMPVCFQTNNIGSYTITVKANELDVEYLHLIDNVTHEDIDLLFDSSYTFVASGHDNAARFTLVFRANANIDELEVSDSFAYQSGDVIIVNGEGTLQVFDVMGRFVRSININGSESINASEFSTGVYVFRMVGNDVKAQKVVIR